MSLSCTYLYCVHDGEAHFQNFLQQKLMQFTKLVKYKKEMLGEHTLPRNSQFWKYPTNNIKVIFDIEIFLDIKNIERKGP